MLTTAAIANAQERIPLHEAVLQEYSSPFYDDMPSTILAYLTFMDTINPNELVTEEQVKAPGFQGDLLKYYTAFRTMTERERKILLALLYKDINTNGNLIIGLHVADIYLMKAGLQ